MYNHDNNELMTKKLQTLEAENEKLKADLDELKKIKLDLITSEQRLELAMQSADMSWWEMEITSGNVTCGKRKTEMLGYPQKDFTHYRDFMALVHPDDYEKTMNAMRRHFEGIVDKYEVEYRIKTKVGEYIWFYDIGTLEKSVLAETPKKITGLVINITARKKAEAARQKAQEEMQKSQLKQEKIEGIIEVGGTLCHEINQPLTALIGYVDILLMKTPSDQQVIKNRITKIKTEAYRMAAITHKLNSILSKKEFVSKEYLTDGTGRTILEIHEGEETRTSTNLKK